MRRLLPIPTWPLVSTTPHPIQVTDVAFRGITVTTEEKALELKTQAEADGGDFEALAAEHSTEAGKMLADMGSMPLSEVAPFIRNQIEGLDTGGISTPIETPMGEWMVVLLKNRTDGVKTLEDAEPELKEKLGMNCNRPCQRHLKALKAEAEIVDAKPPAEGEPVADDPMVMTINGQPYTQSFFIQAVTPQLQMEQQAIFQQLQAQLATVPDAERAAKEAELMQQVQPYFMQIQQQLMEMVVQQILVRDEATKQGYATSAEITTEQGLRRLVLLANVYAEKQAQALIQEGGAPDQAFAEELVRTLWEKTEILDASGTAIAPPEPEEPTNGPDGVGGPSGTIPAPPPPPCPRPTHILDMDIDVAFHPNHLQDLLGMPHRHLDMGCDPVPEVDSERELPEANRAVAFRVNGHPIYREVFDYLYDQSIEQQLAMSRMSGTNAGDLKLTEEEEQKLRTKIRDQLAKNELEFQTVIERGLATQADFDAEVQAEMRKLQPAMEQMIKIRLVDEMLEAEFQAKVTEEFLRNHYQNHLIQYQTDVVILQQLTVRDGQLGMDIKQQVSDGGSFTEMVKTHSIDRFKQTDGRPLGNEPCLSRPWPNVSHRTFTAGRGNR